MMRIITGKAKGVHLVTLEGESTRPTAERVKEAVFSMLQFDIENRDVLDLFAGSGQLSLEALSRGAAHAVMVDKSKEAVGIIKKNAQKTRLDGACEIHNCEYADYIRKNVGRKFDLVFLDPPYASGLCGKAIEALSRADMLKPGTVIVCETGNGDVFCGNDELGERFAKIKHAKYGRVFVTILTPKKDGVSYE